MLRSSDFWEAENDAPIVRRTSDRVYLREHSDDILEQTSRWPAVAGVTSDDITAMTSRKLNDVDASPTHIIVKDAERTFLSDSNRRHFERVLMLLQEHFSDYSQGMSYVAGFLLLTLDEAAAKCLLIRFNTDAKYIAGYWKHEAGEFATDAFVFGRLLEMKQPDLAAKLVESGVLPHTYAQKWFTGLCVHVVPFQHLFRFFQHFIEDGFMFLFKFALALMLELHTKLLEAPHTGAIYEILRLDMVDEELLEVSGRVIDAAGDMVIDENIDFSALREEMFNTKIKPMLNRAAQSRLEAAADDDSDESDLEEGAECDICHDMVPEFTCSECNDIAVCETCHEESKGCHSVSHAVTEYVWPDSDIENDDENRADTVEADVDDLADVLSKATLDSTASKSE